MFDSIFRIVFLIVLLVLPARGWADESVQRAVAEVAVNDKTKVDRQVRQASTDDGIGGEESEVQAAAPEVEHPSEAERISRLQRSIAADKQELDDLTNDLRAQEEDFDSAGKIYAKVEDRLKKVEADLSEVSEEESPDEFAKLTAAVEDIRTKFKLCKERFELALQSKKTSLQQIATLKEKIAQDVAALEKLIGSEAKPAEEAPKSAEPATTPQAPTTPQEKTTAEPAPANLPDSAPAAVPSAPTAVAPSPSPLINTTQASLLPTTNDRTSIANEDNADIFEARSELMREETAASAAQSDVDDLARRLKSLDRSIELETMLYEAARKKVDNASAVATEFHEDFQTKSAANAPAEELSTIGQRIESAEFRLQKHRAELENRTDRLHELQSQQRLMLSERAAAIARVEKQQAAARDARSRLESLENPFSRRNLTRWLLTHGPNIVVIIGGFLALRVMLRLVSRRVVVVMTQRAGGTRKEHENRAETIVSVFHNAATVMCYGGSTIMILDECGVPVGPLVGGAAVIGLAVAFGSQNLIRDYFYGFVILLENQYGINDVVEIGNVTGVVERITLRMTVVRDMHGVNFIPNGRVESVKNLTHGWSRAVIDVSVAYEEDIDRVMDVLMALGHEIRKDPRFEDSILEDPTMLGVEALGDSAVMIKFYLKTRPLEQWNVKREMLRRIKIRFEQLSIEIPFPQRVVNHRYIGPETGSEDDGDLNRWKARKSA